MVAMATYSSHRLIMGKEDINHFFFLIVDLIGCRGGKKGRFS